MKKRVEGRQVFLDGEEFYKIENFDAMDDFFMTIASSSDVWNFCWAQGGIAAGRRNSDHQLFPYATCDKLRDSKDSTGPLTIIKVKGSGKRVWQPFENLSSSGEARYSDGTGIQRNLYKNGNGSRVWFEEVNLLAGLSFRYGWTASEKFGLVRLVRLENMTDKKVSVQVLDGCRNIMPPCVPEAIQTTKSVLLDAYRKGEADEDANVALFSLSSVVTDRAEPSECLTTNVSWFTTDDPIILSDHAARLFLESKETFKRDDTNELNGKRGECYIVRSFELVGKSAECWEQVLDTDYDVARLISLESKIKDREFARRQLLDDVRATDEKLSRNIADADGVQSTGSATADLHHRTNVMFNIMRGGLFADGGRIRPSDFLAFAKNRDRAAAAELAKLVEPLSQKETVSRSELEAAVAAGGSARLRRLFLEYLPLTFSRRHGDPSRPWNRFDIDVASKDGSAKINYEGNWRDIFQNWEALLWSFPEYAPNVCAVFLDAMTAEGYNPYRISRDGIDWEAPEEGDPWAQFGYWGDHQVVYLQKLLEFLEKTNPESLRGMLGERLFSTADIPYRLKSYGEILADPRHSLTFDYKMDAAIRARAAEFGTDARCVMEGGSPQLATGATKIVQLVLAKTLSLVPGAGIWMNTQRPEWNDANNALAGYGASVVTMCYLHRMLSFLAGIFEGAGDCGLSPAVARTLSRTEELYRSFSKGMAPAARKEFVDRAGGIFEDERKELYAGGFAGEDERVPGKEIANALRLFARAVRDSVEENRRDDGLYHSYNTIAVSGEEINVVRLKLMLEGQVAALSSGILSKAESLRLCEALRDSDLFEPAQHSYLLYPNARLPSFKEKNRVEERDAAPLADFIGRTGDAFLVHGGDGAFHFNAAFNNAATLAERLDALEEKPGDMERALLLSLYEKTFNHQSFTGRSGSFYGYEGLGCIYWHMVSKLLLAVQENISGAKDSLLPFYRDVKKGLGSAKRPTEYGAFPCDPYSHTPFRQGARQPGMTGQVKEEVIARWGELGLDIRGGSAVFSPTILERGEFCDDGTLTFSWCGTRVVYESERERSMTVKFADGSSAEFDGAELPAKESALLFSRSGAISEIRVGVKQR